MLEDYAWIIWLALILVFVIVEMFTLEFTFLMLALGGLGGLGAGALGAPWWLQIVIAGALAIVLVLFVRPPLLRALRKGEDPARSNVEALIGLFGVALNDITHVSGQVKLSNGDTWTARLPRTSELTIPEGTSVVVTQIDGATAFVAARTIERTATA